MRAAQPKQRTTQAAKREHESLHKDSEPRKQRMPVPATANLQRRHRKICFSSDTTSKTHMTLSSLKSEDEACSQPIGLKRLLHLVDYKVVSNAWWPDDLCFKLWGISVIRSSMVISLPGFLCSQSFRSDLSFFSARK